MRNSTESNATRSYLIAVNGLHAWFAPNADALTDGDCASDAALVSAVLANPSATCSLVREYGKCVTR